MWPVLFLLLNLLVFFSSHLLCFGVRKHRDFSSHLVTSFLVYVVQISLSVILTGVFVQRLTPISLLLFNTALSSLIIFYWRNSIQDSMHYLYNRIHRLCKDLWQSKDILLFVLLSLFIFQVTLTVIKIYYLPPHVGDVLSYHLHPVAEWFQQAKLTNYMDSPVYRGNQNPLGAKYLHLWFILFNGEITWIELPQFLFGLMLAFTTYSLMLRLNVVRRIAMRMAVLIYFVPTVLLQSRTCQDHLIHAACSMAALLFLVDIVFKHRHDRIVFLGLTLAYLFGIKKHSVVVIAMLVPALFLSRGFNGRKIKAFFQSNSKPNIIAASILLAGATFYILNNQSFLNRLLGLTENNYSSYLFKLLLPLTILIFLAILLKRLFKKSLKKWPDLRTLHRRPAVIAAAAFISLAVLAVLFIKTYPSIKPFLTGYKSPLMRTNRQFLKKSPLLKNKFIKNVLSFPFRIKDIGMYTPYTPDLLEKSGFGIQFFAIGLLSYFILFPLIIFKKEYRNSVMGFLLIFSLLLICIYFLSYFSWANYRSFLFLAIIGLVLWAYIQSRWLNKKYYRVYLDIMIVAMVLFNGLVCFFEGNQYPDRWKTAVTIDDPSQRTVIKYANLLKTWSGPGESWKFIDNLISPGEAIGYSGGDDAWTFPYFDNRLKRKLYFLTSLPGFQIKKQIKGTTTYRMLQFNKDFRVSLKQRGIHYIHFSTQGTTHSKKLFIAEDTRGVVKITPNLYYVKW